MTQGSMRASAPMIPLHGSLSLVLEAMLGFVLNPWTSFLTSLSLRFLHLLSQGTNGTYLS